MKKLGMISLSLVSVSAFAATSTPTSTLRAKPQSSEKTTRTTTEPRYASTGLANTATATKEFSGKTRRTYLYTDLLTFNRDSSTAEYTPDGAASTSTDTVATKLATSPSNFGFAAFYDRYSLRFEKNLSPDAHAFGPAGATETVYNDSSAVSGGYFMHDNLEIGADLLIYSYSADAETGAKKTTSEWSLYGFGPRAVYTMPMSNFDLEIDGRIGYLTGLRSYKDENGTKTKSLDGSGFNLEAKALAVYTLNDTLDYAAGAHFNYLKFSNKISDPQKMDVSLKNMTLGLTLANLRIKF